MLSVLARGPTIAEASRREKASEGSIGRWEADLLEADKTTLTSGRSGPSSREERRTAVIGCAPEVLLWLARPENSRWAPGGSLRSERRSERIGRLTIRRGDLLDGSHCDSCCELVSGTRLAGKALATARSQAKP